MAYWDGTGWVPAERSSSPPLRRPLRRGLAATLEASLIVVLIFGLIAGSALAAKGGGGKYSLEVDDGVYASTTQAEVYGDRSSYWVKASCFQHGGLVSQEWVQTDAAGHATLTLGPTERWTGGSAECIADAGFYDKNFRWKNVASTTFFVSGN